MNQDELVHRFKRGAVTGTASNMFICDNVMYSYGRHFPLVLRIQSTANDGVDFLLNADTYSNSTSRHQSCCQQVLHPVAVAFSAVPFRMTAAFELGHVRIKDHQEDESDRGDGWEVPDIYDPSDGWTIERHKIKSGPETKWWRVHRPGSVLFEKMNWDTREVTSYFCSVDGGRYFCCQLPFRAPSIGAALAGLKPYEVQAAEADEITVHRQGEWFFIETPRLTRALPRPSIRMETLEKITKQENYENVHQVTEARTNGNGIVYARGFVRHRTRWGRMSGQHRTLKLGDKWHRVVRNTAVLSWSSSGRFD